MGIFTDGNGNIREDYKWTIALKDSCLPYPIQFANIERLRRNDTVYIFDETGSGKTISSGLMTLDYLYNHPNKDVLILTSPSLLDKTDKNRIKGQFLDDWFDKLPFKEWDLDKRIDIDNYESINISKRVNRKYGLIVIDEAHEYLEAPKRNEYLREIRAEKVIIMTATPIKRGTENLESYSKIAGILLGLDNDCIKKNSNMLLDAIPEKNGQVICSLFDLSLPVTRYFKDTITALKYVDGNGKIDFTKTKAIRKLPQLWEFETDKIPAIIKQIATIRSESIANDRIRDRFIIFTRLIEEEQEVFRKYLSEHPNDEEHGIRFVDYDEAYNKNDNESVMTYIVINGESEHKIGEFSHNGCGQREEECPLPDIIIITAKIAEAGVNLPGYNYVINYNISKYPSVLEQRFGRIDRMGSAESGTLYESINIVYPFSNVKNYWDIDDSNENNFLSALDIYRDQVISNLPGKNVIFTEDILNKYYQIILEQLSDKTSSRDKNADDEFREFIDKHLEMIKDRIFYCPNVGGKFLKVISPITSEDGTGCAEVIYNSEEYKNYVEDFDKSIKFRKIFKENKAKLETYFEKQFLASDHDYFDFKEGCFDKIFGYDIEEIINEMEEKQELDKDSSLTLKKYCGYKIIKMLPFFRMVRIFGQFINNYWKSYNDRATHYVLIEAWNDLYNEMPGLVRDSVQTCNYMIQEHNKKPENMYRQKRNDDTFFMVYPQEKLFEETCAVSCSNWLKLAFVSVHEYSNPGIIGDLYRYIRSDSEDFKKTIREKYENQEVSKNFYTMFYTDISNLRDWCKYENKSWSFLLPRISSGSGYKNISAYYFENYLKKYKVDFITYCYLRMLLKPDPGYPAKHDCFGKRLGCKAWFDAIDNDIDSIKRV